MLRVNTNKERPNQIALLLLRNLVMLLHILPRRKRNKFLISVFALLLSPAIRQFALSQVALHNTFHLSLEDLGER